MALAEKTTEARRAFLAILTGGLGAVIGGLALVPGLGFLASPLRRPTVRGAEQPLRVASEAEVKPGKPLRVTVVGQRDDAWLRLDRVTVGSCWLVRATDVAPVRAFSTVCPHLGCGVDLTADGKQFLCPCHTSAFSLDGERVAGPSPRAMDPLPVEIGNDDVVSVTFKRFRIGIADRQEIG